MGRMKSTVLEDIEVVGRGERDDVMHGMPGRMQYFAIEIETVRGDLVLLLLGRHGDTFRFQQGAWFRDLRTRFQCQLARRVAFEYAKEVVV